MIKAMTKKQIIAEILSGDYYYNSETEEGFEFWKEAVKKVPEFIKNDIADLRKSIKDTCNDDLDMDDFIFSKEFGEILKPLNLDIQVESESRIDNSISFTEFVDDFKKYVHDLVIDMESIGVTFFEEVKTEKENKVRVFFQDNEWYISINDYALFQVFDKYEDFLVKLHELANEYKLAIV